MTARTQHPFTLVALRAALATHPFVTKVVYQPCVGSTNDLAKELAGEGASEGLLVITDKQSAGRGRMGRQWWAPAGSALLTSLLFRPARVPVQSNRSSRENAATIEPHVVQQLVMLCALAAADAVSKSTNLPVDLKWPNDLIVRGRKLAGLLAESVFRGNQVEAAIVGMGLNVNTDFSDAPAFIAPATSLWQELQHPIDRLPLLVSYLDEIAERYAELKGGKSPHTEWSNRLITIGQHVTAHLNDQSALHVDSKKDALPRYLSGVAEGVDADGALLLRTSDGTLHRLHAADVSLRNQVPTQPAPGANIG